MIIVNTPKLEFIPEEKRLNGISLILRVKNGEDYLKTCMLAAVDQVDEIIAIFNDSIDRTEEILVEMENAYPQKIKLFKYMPKVYPPNDDYYKKNSIRSDDPHSLSHYYNFALSKTKYSHVCKFDDDNLMFPNSFRSLKSEVEKKNNTVAIGLRGINLFDLKGRLYINKMNEHTSGGDTVMFKYNSKCRFVQTVPYEVFQSPYKTVHISVCFYHLKSCKKDRGLNNYDTAHNHTSRYIDMFKKFFGQAQLIPLETYNQNTGRMDPKDLGFDFINGGVKTYIHDLFIKLESDLEKRYK